MPIKPQTIRIAAVGDLLLTTPYGTDSPGRGMDTLSTEVKELFAEADLTLANLECTLPTDDLVAGEPRVLTTEKQLESLFSAGVNLVTLANNHAFDGGMNGFNKTTARLTQLGINFFGAGTNLQQALTPAAFTINGIKIAFFAAVAASTGMSIFATDNQQGVARLDQDQIRTTIRDLKTEYDHVIFVPHWGEERFRFPSPKQLEQAHAFVDAGASLVLGHHPHVLQGSEHYAKGFIAYSLGNFLTNNVYWQNGDMLTWNRFERTSQVLIIELEKNRIKNVEQIPVFDNGEEIVREKTGWGKRCLYKADEYIKTGMTEKNYQREAFRVNRILPIRKQLNWNRLKRLRLEDFKKAGRLLLQKK